jgi:alkylated DNA repair dioxygenase AlkB
MIIKSYKELDGSNSIFIILENFLDLEEQQFYKNKIQSIDDWKTGIFQGSEIQRLQKWYSDNSQYFSKYWANQSHERWKSNNHEKWLLDLREKVQIKIDEIFKTKLLGCNHPILNSSLINYYRDGNDCIKYHSDDEKVFGNNPTISMVTFGSHRNLEFKRIYRKDENDHDFKINLTESHMNESFLIEPGSLFLMMGSVQKYYCHGVEKNSLIKEARYSITFREHKN